ncbi:MAG: hypothetical protein Q4B81_04760, partial [Moraxella sp.]|nr:hypothetical protein [Moraxella sp.]
IAILGILGLIYWVFGFILIQVFGLKVFEKNLTELFGLSVLGILAVLAGALILNIMLNLTRLADQKENPNPTPSTPTKSHITKLITLGVAMFGVMAGGLFWGDHITSQRKFALMQASANQVIENSQDSLGFLGEYRFDKTWIDKAVANIELLEATNDKLNQAVIIVPDTVAGNTVYLGFTSNTLTHAHTGIPNQDEVKAGNAIAFEFLHQTTNHNENSTTEHFQKIAKYLKKSDFIFSTDTVKNEILDKMFTEQATPHHSSHDGRYEIFYPYQVDGKTVAVLYLNDYMAYGKLASY